MGTTIPFTLSVDHSTCIKCGKCVKVCPSGIFVQLAPASEIKVHHPENCIKCGHCVAVCPTWSVIHSEFPPEKVHDIDRNIFPTPEQLMLLIKSRRSNRAFSKEAVPAEFLEQILEAAHRAPTASNMQQVEFTLVTDPGILYKISELTIETFDSIAKKLGNGVVKTVLKPFMPDLYKMLPRFNALKKAFESGNDMILRGATSAIFIHTPRSSRFGSQDSNLAYQNGSLMAESLGVSQFYTGFVCTAIMQDKKRKINSLLGIDGNIHAGLALGMPLFKYPRYIDKKEIKVVKL